MFKDWCCVLLHILTSEVLFLWALSHQESGEEDRLSRRTIVTTYESAGGGLMYAL